MPLPCSICLCGKRDAIDQDLVAGTPTRTIANRWSASRAAIVRHKAAGHVSPALVKLAARREEREARTLLQRMEDLIRRTEGLLVAAEESGAVGQALAAIDHLWKGYELLGRATGELKPDGPAVSVNILQAPEIQLYIQVVRQELQDQPLVLARIAERLALPANGKVPA